MKKNPNVRLLPLRVNIPDASRVPICQVLPSVVLHSWCNVGVRVWCGHGAHLCTFMVVIIVVRRSRLDVVACQVQVVALCDMGDGSRSLGVADDGVDLFVRTHTVPAGGYHAAHLSSFSFV